MSRGYSVSPEEISWSRSKGNIDISASTERSVLSNPLARFQGRGCRKGDEEEPARKRIRVACSRCRKRKIKCSGPIGGEDQPCLNCKNAGVTAGCAFELAGSLKVDMEPRYPASNYGYDIPNSVASISDYPSDHRTYSLGNNILQYSATPYQGASRQRDITQQAYTIPYTGNQPYCDYGQQSSTFDNYSYTTAPNMLQIPSQRNVVSTNQEQFTSWDPELQANCSAYDGSAQVVSKLSLPPTIQKPLISYPSTLPGAGSSVISSTLPKLSQIPLTNSVPSIVIPSNAGETSSWPDDYDSRTESNPSRRSSQDTSSGRSSSNRSSLLDHAINSSMDPGAYAFLPSGTLEIPSTLPGSSNNLQQHETYTQYNLAGKYQYTYSTQKPSPVLMSTPTTAANATSLASIGNHTFSHLPSCQAPAPCGTLQYQTHNGVPKAQSRIPVGGNGTGRRTGN